MWKDPIVEEVRRIRHEIEEECGGDFEQIFLKAVEVQERYADKLVSRPLPVPEDKEALPSVSRA